LKKECLNTYEYSKNEVYTKHLTNPKICDGKGCIARLSALKELWQCHRKGIHGYEYQNPFHISSLEMCEAL